MIYFTITTEPPAHTEASQTYIFGMEAALEMLEPLEPLGEIGAVAAVVVLVVRYFLYRGKS